MTTAPIELTSPDGYRAEVPSNAWPVLGAALELTSGRGGPWPATIVRFGPAKRLVLEYDQRNGEHRRFTVYDAADSERDVGSEVPVEGSGKGHSWLAVVTSCQLVGKVTVEYTTKGGKLRRKDIFTEDPLVGYFEEQPDGTAVFMKFR